MKKKILSILVVSLVMISCGEDPFLDMAGMFSPQGPTVNTRFEQSMAYNDSVGEIHLEMGQDDYIIYLCSDSHISTTHRNLSYFINQYESAASPKLAIHLGDLIDGNHHIPYADSILHLGGRSLQDTLFITPGNHDIYFYQWEEYRQFYKTSAYWFDTNNGKKKLDLFICLDSAEGELGTKQMQWLKELLADKSDDGYRHIIVFTHTHLWKLDASQGHTSNYALETTYELTSLLGEYGVEYVWSGHQHARQSVLFKGVQYLVLDATKDEEKGQSYMTAEMGESIVYHYFEYPKE